MDSERKVKSVWDRRDPERVSSTREVYPKHIQEESRSNPSGGDVISLLARFSIKGNQSVIEGRPKRICEGNTKPNGHCSATDEVTSMWK